MTMNNNNGVEMEEEFIDLMTDPSFVDGYWDNSDQYLIEPELIEASKAYTFEKMLDVMNWTQEETDTFFMLVQKLIDTATHM